MNMKTISDMKYRKCGHPYKDLLMKRFYHMYMGYYEVEGEGLSEEWLHYLLRRLWLVGSACAFKSDVREDSKTKIWIAPFAPQAWSGNDYVSKAQVINPRALPGYPPSGDILEVASDQNPGGKIALCYALPSGLPVRPFFEFYADKILEIQEKIEQNNTQVVLPVLFPTKENGENFKNLVERALREKWPFLPVNPEDIGMFSPTPMAGVYVADKLMEQRKMWENEAKEFLGIDTSADEKRERLTTDEANANNAVINLFRKANQKCLDAFTHNLEYLGVSIKIRPTIEESSAVGEESEGYEKEEGEEMEDENPTAD